MSIFSRIMQTDEAEGMTGMTAMTDQVIATDLLISIKSEVRNLAAAITETATPELREVLREQLNTAIKTHDKISKYMVSKGFYHPYDVKEQIQVDLQAAQTALHSPTS